MLRQFFLTDLLKIYIMGKKKCVKFHKMSKNGNKTFNARADTENYN